MIFNLNFDIFLSDFSLFNISQLYHNEEIYNYMKQKVAEKNLPALDDKEGIQIVLEDLNSDNEWNLKFK